MAWPEYAASFVWLSLAGTLLLYAVLRLQGLHPWSFPEYLTTPLTPDLAFNTAISFATTTTWQAYGGEATAPRRGIGQLLGGRRAGPAVGAPPPVPGGRPGAGLAGGPDDLRAVPGGHRPRGRPAGHRPGPGGGAGDHQEPGDEWGASSTPTPPTPTPTPPR